MQSLKIFLHPDASKKRSLNIFDALSGENRNHPACSPAVPAAYCEGSRSTRGRASGYQQTSSSRAIRFTIA